MWQKGKKIFIHLWWQSCELLGPALMAEVVFDIPAIHTELERAASHCLEAAGTSQDKCQGVFP